jgi:hypothetical protein
LVRTKDVVMNFFKDIQKIFTELLSSYQEKIKSPFAGTFIFFFTLYNWRPIYYFINSESKTLEKIEYINKNFIWDYDVNLFTPFLYSIASLLAYTIASGITILSWQIIRDWLDTLTLKVIEKATFLTQEQERILRSDMREQINKHSEEIKNYRDTVIALERANKNILANTSEKEGTTQLDFEGLESDEQLNDEQKPLEQEDVIQNNAQKSTDLSPSISLTAKIDSPLDSEVIRFFLTTKEGHFKLSKYLAKNLNYDMDDIHDQTDLAISNFILKTLLKEHNHSHEFNLANRTPSTVIRDDKTEFKVVNDKLHNSAKRMDKVDLLKTNISRTDPDLITLSIKDRVIQDLTKLYDTEL